MFFFNHASFAVVIFKMGIIHVAWIYRNILMSAEFHISFNSTKEVL